MATKTETIKLNQYEGSDYVKMADFNNDNLLIDKAFKEDREKIQQIEDNVNGMKLVDSKIHITDKKGYFTGETLDVVLDELKNNIVPTYTEVTLHASKWSGQTYSLEESYPSATYDVEIELSGNATKDMAKAWSRLIPVPSPDKQNVIKALGDVPSTNISIRVKAVRK